MTLRPHQENAYNDLLYGENGLFKNDRAQYISSCGTGKTLTAFCVANSLHDKLSVFLYPTLGLLSQSLGHYQRLYGKRNVSVVCSDVELKKKSTEFKRDENLCLHLKQYDELVIFSTYASSHLVGEGLRAAGRIADIVVFDEAHRVAGSSLEARRFSYALNGELFPSNKRLFATASPKFVDLNSMTGVGHSYSMDNIGLFGRIGHELPMRDAIKKGLITDFRLIVGLVGDGVLPEDKKEGMATTIWSGFVDAIKKHSAKRIIAFHSTIAMSKEFARWIKKYHGELVCLHVDGDMKQAEKDRALERFRDDEDAVVIITNARLLSEGVDMPSADMAGFLSRSSSEIDIIQRIGRVQRLDPRNPDKVGLVYLPIILDSNEKIIYGDKTLFDVASALRTSDQQIRTKFREMILVEHAPREGGTRSGKGTNFPDGIFENIESIMVDGNLLKCKPRLKKSVFEKRWKQLAEKTFTFLLNNLQWPSINAEDKAEAELGKWILSERAIYNAGKMKNDRRKIFSDLFGDSANKRKTHHSAIGVILRALFPIAMYGVTPKYACLKGLDRFYCIGLLIEKGYMYYGGMYHGEIFGEIEGIKGSGYEALLPNTETTNKEWEAMFKRFEQIYDSCGGLPGVEMEDRPEFFWARKNVLYKQFKATSKHDIWRTQKIKRTFGESFFSHEPFCVNNPYSIK